MRAQNRTESGVQGLSFRMYVAGDSPNTRRALQNLRRICEAVGQVTFALDVIDVMKEPKRALQDGILVAPTLVKLTPAPVKKIIGDLSDQADVGLALDLPEAAP